MPTPCASTNRPASRAGSYSLASRTPRQTPVSAPVRDGVIGTRSFAVWASAARRSRWVSEWGPPVMGVL